MRFFRSLPAPRVSLAIATLAFPFVGPTVQAADSSAAAYSLHDLLVAALNTNLELRAKRIDPILQDLQVDAAWGEFMPNAVIAGNYSSTERPKTSQELSSLGSIFGGEDDPILNDDLGRLQVGLTGKLPTGMTYEAMTGVDEARNDYNNFNSEFISNSTLAITQPLLRDFGFKANLAEVRLRRRAADASRFELRAVALRIMRDVTNAYHELVYAEENVRVKEEAVQVAEDLVHENNRRFEEGRMAPIDVTQAQSRVAEAKEELLVARNFLEQRQNQILELTRDSFDLDDTEIVVETDFILDDAPVIDREAALVDLFELNPSYLGSLELIEAEKIRVAYAKNQRWPRVDLRATFGYNGIGGTLTRSYRNYWERTQPSWSAGLVVNYPIWDKAGRSRVQQSEMRKEQAILELKRTEVVLLSAFDTALRDLNNAAARMELVQDSVRLADSALNAELKRLASGLTTSFNVAQAQRDVSTARSRALATRVDLNRAYTQLGFVLGTLPRDLKIEMIDE
ncbi:TolC family protein [Actomonas aquatica]|uniref:TolC family protein n=1 Tax=Actomonas aquatica TaxID=2866162 RepID=A0ABZ1C6N0_9BACT|nr:TolC family protein [Opitutus sp. WL0086]WRQ86184.1 TolC family protein [Opitutus sp. WL0086]